jgi:restriction endonuclease S subunit
VKAGWEQKQLGDILQLEYGKPLEQGDRKPSGRYPVYGANGEKDRTDKFYFGKPSIIVGRKGSAGEINLTEEKFWPLDVTYFATFDRGRHDLRFLYYLLTTLDLPRLAKGVKPGINRNEVYASTVKVPLLPEQQRIVGILDEAFDGIATAKANAEKNLQNAGALFQSHLQSVFTQRGDSSAKGNDAETKSRSSKSPILQEASRTSATDAEMSRLNNGQVTRTGGREATLRHIPGKLSLAVGMPSTGARERWRWSALTDLARLESGHTPSRRHPEYWGGSVPWIGIQDARENHGHRITDTFQKTNELGIANSSARVLPANTVCLSRTASVGYVVVMGRPMATSQDFVNWVCSDKLKPDFLKYLILAEGRDGLLRYASGSVHQTIYFPEVKAFHICHPEPKEQLRIVRQCDALRDESQRLESIYQQKLAALDALKKSLLHQAFSGQL